MHAPYRSQALEVLEDERLAERSLEPGEYFKEKLSQIDNPKIKEVRGRGLFIGVEPDRGGASVLRAPERRRAALQRNA